MKKGIKIFITILVFVLIIGAVLTAAYYLDADFLKTFKKEEGTEHTSEDVKNLPEIKDKTEGQVRKVTLNGKEHTLSFKYFYFEKNNIDDIGLGEDHYVEAGSKTITSAEYETSPKYVVGVGVYFNDVLLNDNVYVKAAWEANATLDTIKNKMLNEFILEDVVETKVIKGSLDGETTQTIEYLFLTTYAIPRQAMVSCPPKYTPLILNDKGEILHEIEDNHSSGTVEYKLTDGFEQQKYDKHGFRYYQDDGVDYIQYLAHEDILQGNRILRRNFYIKTIHVENNEIKSTIKKLSKGEIEIGSGETTLEDEAEWDEEVID